MNCNIQANSTYMIKIADGNVRIHVNSLFSTQTLDLNKLYSTRTNNIICDGVTFQVYKICLQSYQ